MKTRNYHPFSAPSPAHGRRLSARISQKTGTLLQKAVEHHQSGELAQAEALYQEILQLSPNDTDALHLLGVASFQRGNPEHALELIEKAIRNGLRSAAAYSNRGNALSALGRHQPALESYEKAIRLNPNSADAYTNLGNTFLALRQYQHAVESYDKAILLNPDLAEAHNNRGNALRMLKRPEAAAESYRKAVHIRPSYAEAYSNLGAALVELRQYQPALESFRQSLQLNSQLPASYSNLSTVLRKLKQPEIAVQSCNQAVALAPGYGGAYSNRGAALLDLHKYQAALQDFDKAVLLDPQSAEAFSNRGIALRKLKQYEAAMESCDRAIALSPDYAHAYSNRGAVLADLRQYHAALESYDKALRLDPRLADAYSNRGNAHLALREVQAALDDFNKAIDIEPDYAEAYSNRSAALIALHQYDAALESCATAIRLDPHMPQAYCNRGAVFMDLNRYPAALESYETAISVAPEHAKAHTGRGTAMMSLHRYQGAFESYDNAIRLNADEDYVSGLRLHAKGLLCAWEGFEGEASQLELAVESGKKASVPFEMLVVSDSPELQRKAAEVFVQDSYPADVNIPPVPGWPRHNRIRVAYFSSDYYNHATSYLLAELLEQHDRCNFEIFGFSYGPDSDDEMRTRVAAAMDKFIDIRHLPDHKVAQLCREMQIDIAVDLKGFTQGCRTGIFALRAAPVQVNYLGYPGTMGAPYIDYLIADQTVIPEETRAHYSEKIVYLPHSYQVNDSTRCISSEPVTRADEGLPEHGFVYCCFNNSYKITPQRFALWMRLLQRVDGSVLWLLQRDPETASNLRREAMLRGVAPERLVFALPRPQSQHLARHQLADLFLDTSPCNAHTTASDALWAGLPLLTCMGKTFASRVAGSLLRAIHLPELITTTDQEYEALATEIGLNPDRSKNLKDRLARNRLSTPLFDIEAYTRNIEAAYTAMYERHHASMAPEHISIAGEGSAASRALHGCHQQPAPAVDFSS